MVEVMKRLLIVLLLSLALSGCKCSSDHDSSDQDVYFDFSYDPEVDDTEEYSNDYSSYYGGDKVIVPFRRDGGVKIIRVTVNGLPMDMILDTGASSSCISVAEAQYLYNKGLLSRSDFLGTVNSQVADGTIVQGVVINLSKVIIEGDQSIICRDVKAVVVNNMSAPLLLGNEILDRMASVKVLNDQSVVEFTLR